MKVLGIVAEYNPFHNGHILHLKKSIEISKADATIAVISGNFTQRGNTSIVDKWSKTSMALKAGIDLVIELPTLYAISSAENFADGSIKILDSLKIVDYLSFGNETENISCLKKISNILQDEPQEFKKILNHELSLGMSFPKARENSLNKYLQEDCSDLLSHPNNILSIEYLKALKKYNSKITPISIKREKNNYNDTSYLGNIASATAIRKLIINNELKKVENLVPTDTYNILQNHFNNKNLVPDLSCFEKEIIYQIRKMSLEDLKSIPDVSEGLEFKLKSSVSQCNKLHELLNLLKSKRYTQTRLQRILLYILIGVTKSDMELSKNTLPYIRVLGFNENGKKLISNISKANPDLKIITSVKKFVETNTNSSLQTLLDKDILATNIYTLSYSSNSVANLDFTTPIVTN